MARHDGLSRDMLFGAGLMGLALCLLVVAIPLTAKNGVTNAVNVAALVSFLTGIAQLVRSLWVWRHPSTSPQAPLVPDISEAKRVLAGLVGAQWSREAENRSLDTADPIPVQWRVTTRAGVMDHSNKLSPASEAIDNSGYDVSALTKRFQGMKRRRLVVLGDAGTGKTTLTVQMVQQLIGPHPEGQDGPVPVLLPMATWDLNVSPRLQDWIAERLTQDYPALLAASLGPGVPRALADGGHILPVLDGLDELPKQVHTKALRTLNSRLRNFDQLIITSRTTEFEQAIETDQDVIASALVIEPDPVPPTVAADFLDRSLRGPQGSYRARWERVLASVRAVPSPPLGPAGRLADFMATPLHLWLLRAVYIDPNDPGIGTETSLNPEDLLNPIKFPDTKALRAHLFEHLVGALIIVRPPSKNPNDYFRPRHRYDAGDVTCWLGYLAHFMTNPPKNRGALPTPNLVWSRLYKLDDVTLDVTRIIVGVCAGLAFGAVLGIRFPLAVKLPLIFLGGLVGGLLFGTLGDKYRAEPAYANLQLRGRFPDLRKKYIAAFKVPFLFGIAFGLAVSPVVGPATAATAGLAYAIVGTILFGFADWITTESASDRVRTPPSELRGDLRVTCTHVLGVGTAIGVAVGIVFGPVAGSLIAIAFGLTGSLGTTWNIKLPSNHRIPVAFGFGGKGTASAAYFITVASLRIKRRLPRRLMGFLDDAHRLGLLRAAGSTYQFRHSELQDFFAETYASRNDKLV